jgi:hypothetical protein
MTLQYEIKIEVLDNCYSILTRLDEILYDLVPVSEYSTLIINTAQIHVENVMGSVNEFDCTYNESYIKQNLVQLNDIIENIEMIADCNLIAEYANKCMIFNDYINEINECISNIYDLIFNIFE